MALHKRTKIVCTLGPACDSVTTLEHMIMAGMNVARLNFSHGTEKHFKLILKNLRKAAKKTGKTIAVMQDLQGPKIRIGAMPEEGVMFKKGKTVILSSTIQMGSETHLPLQYKRLPRDVKKGDTLFINDGKVQLTVLKTSRTEIHAKVLAGGVLTSNKGINVPGGTITAPPLTAKDLKDVKFALKHNFDYIALSFVRSAKDIEKLRKIITDAKRDIGIIAKVERQEALDELEEIVHASDAIMVARGDLGLEIPAEQVPIEQKRIIEISNRHAKPVIVATQMLDSMVDNAVATRAEISDIANSVLDKTDAVMLSNETSVGKYPVKATQTLAKVANATEKLLQKMSSHEHIDFISPKEQSIFNATCFSAVKIAHDTRAKYLVILTKGGHTAREVAKHRPFVPIISISPHERTHQRLALLWGINKPLIQKISLHDATKQVEKFLKKQKLVKKGDEIVICTTTKNQDLITSITIS